MTSNGSTSNGAMFDIKVEEFPIVVHPYEQFKNKLFETLDYRKQEAVISLHKLFRFIEKTVRVLDEESVYYRCLIVFKALIDCGDKPNKYEVEYLRVHLCETLNDEIANGLAKAACCIRAIVGMKQFHEQVVVFWREALTNPANNVDPAYLKRSSNPPTIELPFLLGAPTQIVKDASRILNTAIPIYGETPKDAVEYESEFIRWNNVFVEKIDSHQLDSKHVEIYNKGPDLDCDTLMAYVNELPESETILTQLTKILNSAKTNDEIQYELIDLLGVDFFEIIAKVLEDRRKFANELTESIRRSKRQGQGSSNYERTNQFEDELENRYAGCVTIETKKQAQMRKEQKKEEKKFKREFNKIVVGLGADERLDLELARLEQMRQRKEEVVGNFDPRMMSTYRAKKHLPFVFDAYESTPLSDIDLGGIKFALPEGTERKITARYQQVTVPPLERSSNLDVHPIMINSMDPVGQLAFEGFEKLNQIQSIVFEQAYNTLENLLICAPTGAGKTNIAMLAVLKTVRDHSDENGILKNTFKIIYIAPMKALATEMTRNFSTRLSRLGLTVKEWTGDTQLTKKEISETQMLVLTPEKWDVVTRKIDDEMLTQLVRLIIIDEVHLLHDERGPVIETIVARTLRQMEVYQNNVRIVGLSATLPNYLDVAQFLRVDPEKGLFFFDGRFRPVPLTQTFVGVSEPNSGLIRAYMDEACYDKCVDFVREDHQVLIFVHSRNATLLLAQFLLTRAAMEGDVEAFLPPNITNQSYIAALKKIKTIRNRDIQDMFEKGIGIHHAGLIRPDRLLMERAFSEGHLKVLCCTSTLAWGVNLPAHAVIINGTDVFDPNKGAFTDLGVLDVQQIFGRAGRPQFETTGHGIIITPMRNLNKYVSMLIRQAPIESRFQSKIYDNLNAEIARGTVSTIADAVEWLRYTYFFIRARLNPMVYGIDYKEVRQDPNLNAYLQDLSFSAAQKLDSNQMVRFEVKNSFLNSTDLGRIAAHYYVTYESIETFLDQAAPVKLTPNMNDDFILALICSSAEFSQIQCREVEMGDLDQLVSTGCVLPFRGGGLATSQGKSNCLLQSYISRAFIYNSTLSSETYYVSQNASRIARALFEIALRKEFAHTAVHCLNFSKFIQRQMWDYNSPLRQLVDSNLIKDETVRKIEARSQSFFELLEYDDNELSQLFKCDGKSLYDCIRLIPSLEAEAQIKPITQTIVRIDAQVWPAFTWNNHLLGANSHQRFWLMIEDTDTNTLMHHEQLFYTQKKVRCGEVQRISVTLPIEDSQMRNRFQLRILSDDWVVEDTIVPLCMNSQVLPESVKPHTDLLDLDPLPISALKNEAYQSIYPFSYFNPVQSQVFFALYHTYDNVLLGAPTSSGKTLCAELTIFRMLQHQPGKKCVYIAPLKALVRERVKDWKDKFEEQLGIRICEVSGDHTPQLEQLQAAHILITTPEKWDGITRSYETRAYVRNVSLVVIDEIHLLGSERGAVLEAIVTRLKIIGRTRENVNPVRIIGLSTALANAHDIANWLGVPESGLFNFRPSVRPIPIQVHIQGFHGPHYCPRMALMNKPAFRAILEYSPVKPVLIFVASRRQTRLTAMAFVSLLAQEPNPKQWLHMEASELQDIVQTLRDENLKITLPYGIGIHHAGLQAYERSIVENLFVEKKIQVLIATSTLAWGINVPAHLVIVKGTEFYDGRTHKYVDFPVTDVLQMIGRAGRPQYDDSAVAVVYVQDMKKKFYKRFLYEPFPVESNLLPVLPNHVNAEICSGIIKSRQDIINYLAGTYLYRRLFANPNYYDIEEFNDQSLINFLTKTVDESINELSLSNCIMQDESGGGESIKSTPFGILASKYYLEHVTIRHLSAKLKPGLELIELLAVLCDCPEYAQIPVRHNEDLINQDMNSLLRFPINTNVDFESSHVKTLLLYQAYFSRMQIHVDYLTDQRSIIESCIRIIQAILDFCVLKGWLDTSILATIILQQVIQGRWFDDHPLLCLPNVNVGIINGIGRTLTIPQLQREFDIQHLQGPPSDKQRRYYESILMTRSSLQSHQAKEIVDALVRWPILRLTDLQLQKDNLECPIDPFSHFENISKTTIPLKSNEDYTLKISIQTFGPAKNNPNVCSSVYSKEKTVGYVLLLAIRETNTILSCRKTGPIIGNDPSTFRLKFKAPTNIGKHTLTTYILSDSYLGIDQEYEFACEVQRF